MSNEQKSKNFLCLYHKNCNDGFGAAFSFWKRQKRLKLLNFTEFKEIDYGDPLPDIKGRIVYIVDFSISQEKILEIINDVCALYIFDHHKTAILELNGIEKKLNEEQKKKFTLVLDDKRSGTGITNDYFAQRRTAFIDCIESRDLFTFKHPYTSMVFAYLPLVNRTFEAWEKFENDLEGNHGIKAKDDILQTGQRLVELHRMRVSSACKNARTITFQISARKTVEVPVVNCSHELASDVLNALAKDKPFAVSYFDEVDSRKFSLRSSETGLDVEEVAKFHGGGGHKRASAFRLPLSDLKTHFIVFPHLKTKRAPKGARLKHTP